MSISALQSTPTAGGATAGAGAVASRSTQTPGAPAATPAAAEVASSQTGDTSRAALEVAVTATREQLGLTSTNLKISIDDQSGKTVVKVVDGDTDEVIRQIPSEEMLSISRRLGALLDHKV